MEKLVVVIMGQNCEKFIGMSIKSVKDADQIIYCDGGSIDNTMLKISSTEILNNINTVRIHNKWNPEDKAMNGKQRNFYLQYIKETYPDYWCLVLDADEMVEDLSKIKEYIQIVSPGIYNVKMRHFIGNLGWEDATHPVHFVPGRLFKISEAQGYPLHSHPVVEGILLGECDKTTIWHMGHLPIEYMKYILKRYGQHKEDSIIHDDNFLRWWRDAHLYGRYPVKQINPREIPKIILDELGIDSDEVYSNQENIELKHIMMVKQWKDFFHPSSVLDLGCGRGCYLYFWKWFLPTNILGIDINSWAVHNGFTSEIMIGDISDIELFNPKISNFDLITAIDVLEHLTDVQLDRTLKNMFNYGHKFIFSIPFLDDSNLYTDKTHKQFHGKQWWVDTIESHGIKILDTPKDWLFANQIIVGVKQ